MNILIIIVAGVSAGWATHKLYHAVFTGKKSNEGESFDKQIVEGNEELTKKETRAGNNSATEKEAVVVAKEKTTKEESKKKASKKEAGEAKSTKDAPKNEESTSSKEENVDDLSQLKGVGPKLAEALDEIGIHSYKQLSDSSIDLLITRLRELGGRFSRPAISAVVERAKLAAKEK